MGCVVAGVTLLTGCTSQEHAGVGQACSALEQVAADGSTIRTQLPGTTPNASARQILAGDLGEDVESAQEVLDALPSAGSAARAAARTALGLGRSAEAAVRSSPESTAVMALSRMATGAGAARTTLDCGAESAATR